MATAQELIIRHPGLKLAVVEKENELAAHRSGHNSGVIHTGIYYAPGSLKAKLCVKGLDMAYKYCDQHNIPYNKCGKLIVATKPDEVERLDGLYKRGQKNGVRDLRMVGPEGIKEIEPNCVGLKAIHSPHTGIIDWGLVTKFYGKEFEKRGGKVYTNFKVDKFSSKQEGSEGGKEGMSHPLLVQTEGRQNPVLNCRYVVTCGGLHSDKLAEKSGCDPEPKIVQFIREYNQLLSPEKENLVRGNIHPVPEPIFPFLMGAQFTPRMDGSVWLGPKYTLACIFNTEGYKWSIPELAERISYWGLLKASPFKPLQHGLQEIHIPLLKPITMQLKKFVPSLNFSDVQRGPPSGVRAQALDRDGNLVDDFIFDSGSGDVASRVLHVRNAPSPAATSSLAIAEMIADKVEQRFQL